MTWMRHACAANEPLRGIMRNMDDTGVPIALVVDYTNDVLQGTITDGDIRRWLLKGGNLDAVAEDVMQPSPHVEYIDGPKTTIPPWVTLIPQVGYLTRRVFGLKNLRKTHQTSPVVIMAGGLGTRLRPLTDDIPKPMLLVGGKPILQRLVEQFVAQGFTEIWISVGYKASVIKEHFGDGSKYGATIHYLEEDQARGTAGALALLPKFYHPVLVCNGDVVTDVDFRCVMEFHVEHMALATICVREYKMKVQYGVVKTTSARVDALVEKPDVGFKVNAGIYVISHIYLPPPASYGERVDMTTLVSGLIPHGAVIAFPLHEKWLDVGTPETLAEAQKEYARG